MAAFKFDRLKAQDASKIFGNLSKTIQQHTSDFIALNELEDEREKVHEATQLELDKMFGFTEATGQGLEAYKRAVQDQQAEAQRVGLIKAYENLTFVDDVEKERAGIIIDAYSREMRKMIPQLAVPTDRATTGEQMTPDELFKSSEKVVWDTLINEGILGVDSAGVDVRGNLDELSTGEFIALSNNLNSHRTAIQNAVEDLKEAKAIEISTNNYQREIFKAMDDRTDPLGQALSAVGIEGGFQEAANKAFGLGVQNINALTLESIESYTIGKLDRLDATAQDLTDINDLLDAFQEDIVLVEGNGVFGSEGTSNFIKLESIRNQAYLRYNTSQKAQNAMIKDVQQQTEDEIISGVLEQILADPELTNEDLQVIRREAAQLALDNSIYDVRGLLGNVDSLMEDLKFDDSSNRVDFLSQADASKLDAEALNKLQQTALDATKRGVLSSSSFGVIRTSINKYLEDLETEEVASYAEAKKRIRSGATKYESVMKNILEFNDRREVTAAGFVITTGRGQDNTPQPVYIDAIRSVVDDLDSIALRGGTYRISKVKFKEEDREYLVSQGVPEFLIKEVEDLEVFSFPGPVAEGSREEEARARQVDRFASAYAQYQGMLQMIQFREYLDQADEDSFTGGQ